MCRRDASAAVWWPLRCLPTRSTACSFRRRRAVYWRPGAALRRHWRCWCASGCGCCWQARCRPTCCCCCWSSCLRATSSRATRREACALAPARRVASLLAPPCCRQRRVGAHDELATRVATCDARSVAGVRRAKSQLASLRSATTPRPTLMGMSATSQLIATNALATTHPS